MVIVVKGARVMSLPINISASRGAAILGLSKYQTPVQVWLQIMESRNPGFCAKNNYQLPVVEDNPSMRWGSAFESAIIELAERKSGNDKIEEHEKYFFEPLKKGKKLESEVITCHIDGRYRHRTVIHEGKTTTLFYFADNFGEDGTDQVPIEYQIQCQHQIICTGAEKVILSVLVFPKRPEEWEEMGIKFYIAHDSNTYIATKDNFGLTISSWAHALDQMGFFHQFTITANAKLQKSMIKHYSDFWFNNVLKAVPPEPIDISDIKLLCREPVGTIIADENIERQINELDNIKSEIGKGGSLAKRADQIKLSVLEYMRGAEKTLDQESDKKWILRGSDGKKLASYYSDKNGNMIFR